jgi:hypothetical protein
MNASGACGRSAPSQSSAAHDEQTPGPLIRPVRARPSRRASGAGDPIGARGSSPRRPLPRISVSGHQNDHHPELQESSLAPSLRRRSEEMAALPAVRPARPPAIKPPLMALLFVKAPPSASSEALTVSRTRSDWLFLLRNLILSPPSQRLRDALVIASTSWSLVMFVRPLIPMPAASSISSGLW